MTAIELWMQWQAAGTPAPIAICELVVSLLERDYGVTVSSEGMVNGYAGNDCHRGDLVTLPKKWRHVYGFAIGPRASANMRCWAFYGEHALLGYELILPWRKTLADPEVIEWAKGWVP